MEINVSSENNSFFDVDGVLFNKNVTVLITYPPKKVCASYIVPNTVISIGSMAFANCTYLFNVEISNSVNYIGESAFFGCSSLKSIVLPFVGANKTATEDSSLFGYIFGIISYEGSTPTLQYALNYITYYIPRSLKTVTILGGELKYNAFDNCNNIKSIILGDFVFSVSDSVFSNCTSLFEIKVSAENAYYSDIDGVLFNKDATTLIAYPNAKGSIYIIPNSVTSINYQAFNNCLSIISLVLSKNITSIKYTTFSYCKNLSKIYYYGTQEEFNSISVENANDYFNNATKYFYSAIQPQESGNYWYYNQSGEIVVW